MWKSFRRKYIKFATLSATRAGRYNNNSRRRVNVNVSNVRWGMNFASFPFFFRDTNFTFAKASINLINRVAIYHCLVFLVPIQPNNNETSPNLANRKKKPEGKGRGYQKTDTKQQSLEEDRPPPFLPDENSKPLPC